MQEQEVTAPENYGRSERRSRYELQTAAAAKEMSRNAAIAAVSSELNGVFTQKEKQKVTPKDFLSGLWQELDTVAHS